MHEIAIAKINDSDGSWDLVHWVPGPKLRDSSGRFSTDLNKLQVKPWTCKTELNSLASLSAPCSHLLSLGAQPQHVPPWFGALSGFLQAPLEQQEGLKALLTRSCCAPFQPGAPVVPPLQGRREMKHSWLCGPARCRAGGFSAVTPSLPCTDCSGER